MSWQWTAETRARLDRFLKEHGLIDEIASIRPIGDGHSNLTYRIDGSERSVVLRRPPPPPLEPGSNDVLREAQLLKAVQPAGLPVPEILAVAQPGEVLDVPFYVMALVDGVVITDVMPALFAGRESAGELGHALVDGMLQLHAIDWQAAGLSGFGRPEGFNGRHLKRMAAMAKDASGGILPEFAEVHDWLSANVPVESGATIIHNDLRIGNVMWRLETPPRLAAILDWELATLGDPLLDLAYLLASLPQNGECRTPVQDFARACLADGFPSGAELGARYAGASGRDIAALNWYLAMVNWKLAIFYRFSRLRGHDPYYEDDSHVARFLAEASRHIG